MCGFDTGLGKEINESIVKAFPSCIEINLSLQSENLIILSGVKSNKGLIYKNIITNYHIDQYNTSSKSSNNKSILNQMYFQMLISQKNIVKLPFKLCKFILKSENDELINIGIELIFIHSLVYIENKQIINKSDQYISSLNCEESNVNQNQYQGEFGYVINFDKEFVYLLTPFDLEYSNNSYYKISKSSNLCLDLEKPFITMMNPSLNENDIINLDLPYKGLKLNKKISTKLRKKISKRKNISK